MGVTQFWNDRVGLLAAPATKRAKELLSKPIKMNPSTPNRTSGRKVSQWGAGSSVSPHIYPQIPMNASGNSKGRGLILNPEYLLEGSVEKHCYVSTNKLKLVDSRTNASILTHPYHTTAHTHTEISIGHIIIPLWL